MVPILNKKEKTLKKPVRILLIILGTFLIGISIVGIFIPVLPTTPFLLLAAALYAKSSRRFYNWLVNNRILGRYIKNYREGKGIPLKVKIITEAVLEDIHLNVENFAIDILWVRILLVVIAVGVTVHIVRVKPGVKNNTDISD